jgi:hypothetical protein
MIYILTAFLLIAPPHTNELSIHQINKSLISNPVKTINQPVGRRSVLLIPLGESVHYVIVIGVDAKNESVYLLATTSKHTFAEKHPPHFFVIESGLLNISSKDMVVDCHDIRKLRFSGLNNLAKHGLCRHVAQIPHNQFNQIMGKVFKLKYLTNRQRMIMFQRVRDTFELDRSM